MRRRETLEIRDLRAAYGGVLVFTSVSAVARLGDVVAITGPNGGGKSTLLKLIGGQATPAEGAIRLGECRLTGHKPWVRAALGVSYQFQGQHLAWNLSVQQQLSAASAVKRRRADFEIDSTSLLEDLGLASVQNVPTWQLSHGQQRLLGFALAVVVAPTVLLLDEPFAGLSPESVRRVIDILANLASCTTTLIVDHDLQALRHVANRFWLVVNERMTEYTHLDELHAAYRSGVGDSEDHDGLLVTPTQDPAPASALLRARAAKRIAPLVLQHVSVSYGHSTVLKEVSLAVASGEIVCVIGRNGSGKSTLLRAIMGLIETVGGEVLLNGFRITHWSTDERVRHGLRMLPQAQRVFQDFTVADNIHVLHAVGARLRTDVCVADRSHDRSNSFDIAANAPRIAQTLSGGEQSRLAFEMLRYGPTDVLLLDEPTAGLDPAGRRWAAMMVNALRDQGCAIVIVEHDLAFVRDVATRVQILRDGEFASTTDYKDALSTTTAQR